MTIRLLDANVLIALADDGHDHHVPARTWFPSISDVATCPITEGALVRYLLRMGTTGGTAADIVAAFADHPRFHFLPDAISYREVELASLRGHKQATDAYLVSLARHHGARLATFDTALATTWPEHTELVPT